MYAKRIIPCLDLKNGRVVKGTNFVGLRDAGDPVAVSYTHLLATIPPTPRAIRNPTP